MQKAVFIDYQKENVPAKYLNRITRLFGKCVFLPRADKRLLGELKGADAIFAKIFTKIDKEVIDASPKLKYVGVLSTAFDAIDAKYARKKGVTVCNLGGYSTEAVAEFAIAAVLERVRTLEEAKIQARKADFSFANFMGLELSGKTLGVVGAGKIGSRIAEIGLGFGMKVLYFSRKTKPALDKKGAKKAPLNRVLSESDFVALALLLSKETQKIISRQKLAMLKKGCIFVNIAPPSLVDNRAVLSKAAKGEFTYIFDHSDDISSVLAKKFLGVKNCVVYPPVAFRTEEANTARLETFASNIEQFVKGKPQNVVN